MQRIFNGRYLLLAVALLAVWMLGRNRLTQPKTDASWSEISASEWTADQVEATVAAADHENGSCSDCPKQVDVAQQVEPAIDSLQELSSNDELTVNDLLAPAEPESASGEIDSISSTIEPGPLAMLEPEAQVAETAQLQSADPIATIGSTGDAFRKARPIHSEDPAAATSVARVGNQFAQAAQPNAGNAEKPEAWRKNPFADQPIESQGVPSDSQNSPHTDYGPRHNSVLDLGTVQPEQVSSVGFENRMAAAQRPAVAPKPVGVADSVAQQAVHHIEYGKSLSRRGASYCARQEFLAALGVIARGNDAQIGSNAHTTALRRAIQALREVGDFAVTDAETQIGMNLVDILETHQTQIIAPREAISMTPVQAMQRYFTFAHQQLDFTGGRNVVVAEALFCLGKLHTVMAKHQPETLDIAKAIVFHRTALLSDASNFRSANELGVLLARSGKLNEAEALMKQGLQIRPSAETWQNLAKIHQRQGETGLAQLAQSEFTVASQMDVAASRSSRIQWLPQEAFNQVGPTDFHDSAIPTVASGQDIVKPASRTAALDPDEKESKKKSFAERLNLKKWF